jgi:hypothetical protein
MITATDQTPRAVRGAVTDAFITATFADGRVVSAPLGWSWRLERAAAAQRANHRPICDGVGFHWPDVDENVTVEGMLRGTPAADTGPVQE